MPIKGDLNAENAHLRKRVEQLERLVKSHGLSLPVVHTGTPPTDEVFGPSDKQSSTGILTEPKTELPSSQWALIAWLINKCPRWFRIPLISIVILAIGGTIAYLTLPDDAKKFLIPSIVKQQHPQAKDPNELNQVFVTVLYERNTVDLTWWISTASNLLDNRVVPEKRTITLKVIKRSDQTKFFTTDVYTSSSLSPDFVCFTHPWEFREEQHTPEVGAPALKKYQVLIDISKAAIDSEFEIRFQYIVWNTKRGTNQSWAEIGIYHETTSAELEVLFPSNKLPSKDSLQFSYSPLYRPSLDVIDKQNAVIQQSNNSIVWSLNKTDLKINYRYRMQWQW